MHPYTALKLKERKFNTMKDFLKAAGMYGVSHMMMISQSEKGNYLKIAKNPKGPTLTFDITSYSTASDIVSFMQQNKKVSKVFSSTLQTAPLLIMNGFNDAKERPDMYKVVSLMCQSMFPSIQISSMNLSACKRVVLLSLEQD